MTDEEKTKLKELSTDELVEMVAGYKDKSDAAERKSKDEEEKAKKERLEIINKFFNGDPAKNKEEAKADAGKQDEKDAAPDKYEQRLINKFKWR